MAPLGCSHLWFWNLRTLRWSQAVLHPIQSQHLLAPPTKTTQISLSEKFSDGICSSYSQFRIGKYSTKSIWELPRQACPSSPCQQFSTKGSHPLTPLTHRAPRTSLRQEKSRRVKPHKREFDLDWEAERYEWWELDAQRRVKCAVVN